MKSFLFVSLSLSVPTYGFWVHPQNNKMNISVMRVLSRQTLVVVSNADKSDTPGSSNVETDDPCWQNMLDDDCSMGTIYSSNFVAGDWIKSMPCGDGIEVRNNLEEFIFADRVSIHFSHHFLSHRTATCQKDWRPLMRARKLASTVLT